MASLTAAELAITRPDSKAKINHKPMGWLGKTAWSLMHVRTAFEVYTERRQLMKLTDHQLNDIGVTRQQVLKEYQRSFFDIPNR